MTQPILIVEDDADIRTDLAELLRSEGHNVVTAGDGLEALSRLRQAAPRLILLDLMMPVMDGWRFRAEMLKDPALARIPVVLLSGAGNLREAVAALGAAGSVAKPFTLDAVLRAVEQHG